MFTELADPSKIALLGLHLLSATVRAIAATNLFTLGADDCCRLPLLRHGDHRDLPHLVVDIPILVKVPKKPLAKPRGLADPSKIALLGLHLLSATVRAIAATNRFTLGADACCHLPLLRDGDHRDLPHLVVDIPILVKVPKKPLAKPRGVGLSSLRARVHAGHLQLQQVIVGRAVDFEVWVDDLQLFLQCDRTDGLSLFDLTSGVSPAPPATADSTVRSQWASRDAAARLAVRRHLPTTE
ncbi:unnamed protein product, partial [Closterium sp. NIES-54]